MPSEENKKEDVFDENANTMNETLLSQTFTKKLVSHTGETKSSTQKKTLNKTYTVRSSLNEVENLSPPFGTSKETLENISEDLFDSLKKDVDKLKANVHEKSAVTIQKTFRGFRTRKNLKPPLSKRDSKTISVPLDTITEVSLIKEETKFVATQEATIEKVAETKEEEGSSNVEKLNDLTALDKAATNIQKTYRGYKTRKNYQAIKKEKKKLENNNIVVEANEPKTQTASEDKAEESSNHSLDKSAITIQKTFRGYQTRKQLKSKKTSQDAVENNEKEIAEEKSTTPTNVLNLHSKNNGEHAEEASSIFEDLQRSFEGYKKSALDKSATTIQKHYRGYKTRKDINTNSVRNGISNTTEGSNLLHENDQLSEDQDEVVVKSIDHQNKVQKSEIKVESDQQEQTEPETHNTDLKTEEGTVTRGGELKKSLEDLSDLEKSATTIQKNFRGYKTRKQLKRQAVASERDSKQRTEEITEENSITTKNKDESKILDNQKQGAFDSFDVEEFHNDALQKSATTIQKTFRGYQTRKELRNRKISTKLEGDQVQDLPEDQSKSRNSNKESSNSVGEAVMEQSSEKITDTINLDLLQKSSKDHSHTENLQLKDSNTQPKNQPEPTNSLSENEEQIKSTSLGEPDIEQTIGKLAESEDHTSTVEEPSLNSSESLLLKKSNSESTNQQDPAKSLSAGAILENAASTIQKAYRGYHAKKNNLSTKSYSNRARREETTPKEVLENSDESSTFIGPDTSFDLSDVDSVETKSEKNFDYDKINSSEAHTPVNIGEDNLASALTINVQAEDKEIDNESTIPKLRLKRSIIEPTAPPLDEILKADEIVDVDSPKLKWFVGEDPIIPSDSSSSSSASVNNLVSSSSKINNLSSIDACRENLNSNQQLTPSINSTVVSTSSLLHTNNTEINNKNTLNKNSGVVSANNEEEKTKNEDNNLAEIDHSEEISKKSENEDKVGSKVLQSQELKDTEIRCENKNEDKQDLCKNCAQGIHEGGVCSKDLIKNKSNEETKFDPSDPIKHFVLMEELNHGKSIGGKTESSVISTQNEETNNDSSNVAVTLNDVNKQGSQTEVLTEELKSSTDCPAISLIPPSSEDDVSEKESIHDPIKADEKDDGVTKEKSGKVEIGKEGKKEDESKSEIVNEESKVKTQDETDIAKQNSNTDEDVSGMVNSKEDKKNSSSEEKSVEAVDKEATESSHASKFENIDDNITEIKNVSIDEKSLSKHSSNEDKDTASGDVKLNESLEDAFKTRPGEEFEIKEQGFEDDFSDSKDVEEASEDNTISTELQNKTQKIEEGTIETIVENEESLETLETNKNEDSNHDLDILNKKSFEDKEDSDKKLSEIKDLQSKSISEEKDSDKLGNQDEVSNEHENENSHKTESFEKKIEKQNSVVIGSKPDDVQKNNNLTETSADGLVEINEQNLDDTKGSQQNEDTLSETVNDGTVTTEVSNTDTSEAAKTEVTKEVEKNCNGKEKTQSQEDLEIAAKLIESSLSDPQANLLEKQNQIKSKISGEELSSTNNDDINCEDPEDSSKTNQENLSEAKNQPDSPVQAKLERLIEDNLKPTEKTTNTVDPEDLPVENSSNEIIELPCVKKIVPPPPYSASSDPDESELESTTTKAESTTTTPGYDETSETDALDMPVSKPDALDAMAEKLREPEEMVARMRQRRASEHKISMDSVIDQQSVFEGPICEPIKPMQKLQKASSTDVEDEFVLQKLQRSDTTRESSAQSESVVFGDSTSQLTESEDTFNENLDLHSLHRMNTISSNRSTFKSPSHLLKSVTIDETVKYIDPEKSTEESGSSFCMDDATSEDVRKKMMAYSVSEADSDYYDVGEQTNHPHDDFNISTALDNFPSTDTDTTIVSAAATKIQAGARGFLTRRRIRRASMGTKTSLTEEEKNLSFESLDQLAEEEVGRRQFNRQTGVNSLPSALEHSDETLSPQGEDMPTSKHSSIKIEAEKANKTSTSSENDVNDGGLDKLSEDDSFLTATNLEATVARRLTLQRGDALRNDSTPDDENGGGNGKQVDLAKNNAALDTNTMFVHEKTMVESTTTTTTKTTTERRNYSDAAVSNKKNEIKWFALRQNSMPVQIDSEVFRVLPKHMRKRIKSAEGEKPKRIRYPRD